MVNWRVGCDVVVSEDLRFEGVVFVFCCSFWASGWGVILVIVV